jgi:Resolvase, N terminal domain
MLPVIDLVSFVSEARRCGDERDAAVAILGRARVSTNGQELTGQVAELQAAGCSKIYQEKVSGAKTDRAQTNFGMLLRALEPGDVLIVTNSSPSMNRTHLHELGGSRSGVSSVERRCRPPDVSYFAASPAEPGELPLGFSRLFESPRRRGRAGLGGFEIRG